MDNLTHSLAGAALAQTRLGRLHPHAFAWLVVAANLPDLDVVSMAWGKEAYLVEHRGVTHGVLGVVVLVFALAACMRLVDALRGRARVPWSALLALGLAGVASHPLLDFLNPYGLRPWLPFDATWYYGDLVFIAEPWLWLVLGAAIALAGERTRAGSVALALTAAACSAAIYATDAVPGWFRFAWPAALTVLAVARWRGIGRERPERVLRAAALAFTAFVALQACESHFARAAVARAAIERRESWAASASSFALPSAADPTHWTVLVDAGERIVEQEARRVGPLGAALGPAREIERRLDDPAVRSALGGECTAWWRSFVRLGYAETRATEGGTLVELKDARYPAPWCTAEVLVRPDGTLAPAGARPGSNSDAPLRSAR